MSSECPVPFVDTDEILLGHGSGGRLTAELVERLVLPAFDNAALRPLDDCAVLDPGGGRIAMTTDSWVVTPLFFPGGDIGELAVYGTVNDLAAAGARPIALSLAMILEEGLPIEVVERVIASVRRAALRVGVPVVTGDTKVVGRGQADRMFLNTTGIGVVPPGVALSSARVAPGDVILLSGTVGDHGAALLVVREGLEFGGPLASDTAPLHDLAAAMLAAFPDVHCLRDPSRGGVAAALIEIATRRGLGMTIAERAIPVREAVQGLCELLGLDPLLVANEGKLLAFVPPEGADRVLAAMREHPLGRDAVRIGAVLATDAGRVRVETAIGGERLLDLPYGELLPRIC